MVWKIRVFLSCQSSQDNECFTDRVIFDFWPTYINLQQKDLVSATKQKRSGFQAHTCHNADADRDISAGTTSRASYIFALAQAGSKASLNLSSMIDSANSVDAKLPFSRAPFGTELPSRRYCPNTRQSMIGSVVRGFAIVCGCDVAAWVELSSNVRTTVGGVRVIYNRYSIYLPNMLYCK